MKKRTSVADELETRERLIRREEADLNKHDPLAVEAPPDREKQKLVEDGEKADLIVAMKNPAIRRLLYKWIVVEGDLYGVESDQNPIIMSHHVGRRSLALGLCNAIREADLSLWHQAESEGKSNFKSKEASQ